MITFWTSFKDLLVRTLAPPLQRALAPLDHWLAGLPSSVGQICAVTLFVLAALWVLTLKRQYIYQGAPDQAWWRDLRLWSILAMLPYIVLYTVFK